MNLKHKKDLYVIMRRRRFQDFSPAIETVYIVSTKKEAEFAIKDDNENAEGWYEYWYKKIPLWEEN